MEFDLIKIIFNRRVQLLCRHEMDIRDHVTQYFFFVGPPQNGYEWHVLGAIEIVVKWIC